MSHSIEHIKGLSSQEVDKLLIHSQDAEHPANVICELCRLFYDQNWVTGTGGGMSVRDGDLVYLAPSGVQKEVCKMRRT
jgi:methylthioribulose-1-phosphate dehydratase